MEQLCHMLRAAGDPTRLAAVFWYLREAELTVSELTQILGQSQPRVSRHLKLLCDAGLLERFKEGSWVFYRAAERGAAAELGATLVADLAEDEPARWRPTASAASASARHAPRKPPPSSRQTPREWERIRSLHAPDTEVEAAITRVIANRPRRRRCSTPAPEPGGCSNCSRRMIRHGVGVDVSPEMLAIARDRLGAPGCGIVRCALPMFTACHFRPATPIQGFDAALFHQVLHYLDDPQAAVAEAARVLKPGGRILIVDFAPHELEFLRARIVPIAASAFPIRKCRAGSSRRVWTRRRREAIAPDASKAARQIDRENLGRRSRSNPPAARAKDAA